MTKIERFENKLIPVPESGCWIWEAGENGNGYGYFRLFGKMMKAHRAAYHLYVGEVPDDAFVLHRCDVKLCVNPDHLFLGTHQDNMNDMVKKGRQLFGEKNPSAVLTERQAIRIYRAKKLGVPISELAYKYGVSKSVIKDVGVRRWMHLF